MIYGTSERQGVARSRRKVSVRRRSPRRPAAIRDWITCRSRLIRFRTVKDRTGLSRSTIWRLERTGAFPKHHRISPNAVAWVEQDVVDWMRAKASAR